MNAVTPQSQMPTAAARLVQTIINWFPKAEPSPDWTKQATITLSAYPMDVLKAIHQRGQLEFRGFPSIPALAQLASRVAGDLHPVQKPDRPKYEWELWDARANELSHMCHRQEGWPKYWSGYSDTMTWLTKKAYAALRAGENPSVASLLLAMPIDLQPPRGA